ncbi:class I SAM-dependent methyltransferase [Paenibacillus thermoaerophilus]
MPRMRKPGAEPWVHLPQMPLTEEMRRPGDPAASYLADIDVYVCGDCGVSQTVGSLEMGDYYADYGYTVGSSRLASRFMERLAAALRRRYGLADGFKTIEIGSGDGTQLACFKRHGADVYGVEPSAVLCRESRTRGVPVLEALFGPGTVDRLPEPFREADVLLMTYTFDHLPDPADALAAARRTLHPRRGLLVLEVHDLEQIVRRREYCLFEHEHYTYWTAATLKAALARSGFRLLTAKLLPERDRRGNSLLVVASPFSAGYQPEDDADGEPPAIDYAAFQQEMRRGIDALDAFVETEAAAGRRIAGYGAGGRGVMTMAAMRSAGRLAYVCDANPGLHGRIAPKSGVPVAGVDRLATDPVDTLLVFSYGYMEEIAETVARLPNAPGRIVSMLDVLK